MFGFIAGTPAVHAEPLTLACLDLPPYTGSDKPDKGLLSEIAATAAKRAGFQPKILLMPWKRVYDMALRGTVDGIFCTTFAAERTEFLAYSQEAISIEKYVLFSLKGSGKTGGPIDSLRGSYFAEIPSSAWDTELRRRGINTILPISTEPQKFRALFAGRTDYALADEMIGWAAAQECCPTQVEALAVVGPTIRLEPQFISISRKRRDDADAVAVRLDTSLAAMLEDGTLETIYRRHALEKAFDSYLAYRKTARQ